MKVAQQATNYLITASIAAQAKKDKKRHMQDKGNSYIISSGSLLITGLLRPTAFCFAFSSGPLRSGGCRRLHLS